jgi:hypothetical protein
MLFEDHAQSRCAILLENKIDAPPQPDQGIRYGQRAELGVVRGEWKEFRTAILAPRKYLQMTHDARAYQASIPYEDLRDWFGREGDPRALYKMSLIGQAIDQSKRGYSPKADERVTKFFQEYWLCASREFPELEMPQPGMKPVGSYWVGFRPRGMAKDRYIWHKTDVGRVDLELKGASSSIEPLQEMYSQYLAPDMEIAKAGKSAAIRIHVPVLDILGEFADQIDIARAGMRAVYRLVYLSRIIRGA